MFKAFFKKIDVIPVDRENIDIKAIKAALRILKKRKIGLLIFPEGTRNKTKNPLKAKSGALVIATKSKVPIIPVSVDSTFKLFSTVNITVHEPINTVEFKKLGPSKEDYSIKSQEIIDYIYQDLVLYKERAIDESH